MKKTKDQTTSPEFEKVLRTRLGILRNIRQWCESRLNPKLKETSDSYIITHRAGRQKSFEDMKVFLDRRIKQHEERLKK